MYPDSINTHTVGKLGNRVYYYYGNQRVSRSYFIPVQPGSPAQLARWQKFRDGVSAWQALTPGEKEVYNSKAARLRMEGFNLFMREYLLS